MADLPFIPKNEFERIKGLRLPREEYAELFAALCRINILYMITRAGSGHIGSSFSSLDIVTWLFLNELPLSSRGAGDVSEGIYFSSKGHDVPGLYSVLIALGLLDFDLIHRLRKHGGLPGHPDISTPYMITNTGSLGMGISKAKGMVMANRLLGKRCPIYIMIGDGELQEGQIWESLPSAVNRTMGEITVIIDHNKIQSDTWVAKTSDLGNLEKKFAAFGWHTERCSGHSMKELSDVFLKINAIQDRPKIIIADTVKGRGVSFMEGTAMKPDEERYRFHSGAPDDETYLAAKNELVNAANGRLRLTGAEALRLESLPRPVQTTGHPVQRLINSYAAALVAQAERNPGIVVLDADLKVDCGLVPFQTRFPERFFECGIAEQDMVSMAGGMALTGLLPVVHSFSCFLSSRPNEQIYNNASEKTKIIYVGSLAGILPGGPGHSHQAVRDISVLAAVPNLVLCEPCTESEVALVLDFCLNRIPRSSYLRIASIPCEIPYSLPDDYQPHLGKGVAITEGRDAVLVTHGPVMLTQAYKAARMLQTSHGIGLSVLNLPWLNYVDRDWLRSIVRRYQWMFTLDDHYLTGSQGEQIACAVKDVGSSHHIRVQRFGISAIPACGQNDEVLAVHQLDAGSLTRNIAALLLKRKENADAKDTGFH